MLGNCLQTNSLIDSKSINIMAALCYLPLVNFWEIDTWNLSFGCNQFF